MVGTGSGQGDCHGMNWAKAGGQKLLAISNPRRSGRKVMVVIDDDDEGKMPHKLRLVAQFPAGWHAGQTDYDSPREFCLVECCARKASRSAESR